MGTGTHRTLAEGTEGLQNDAPVEWDGGRLQIMSTTPAYTGLPCRLKRSPRYLCALRPRWCEKDAICVLLSQQAFGESSRLLPMLHIGIAHPQFQCANPSRTFLCFAVIDFRTILLGPTGIPWPLDGPVRISEGCVTTYR
jgi:hypothetical protein